MKSVTTAMDAHLKQGATTLTTCWIITRTDGQTFYYTELDEDVTFEGNVYKSAAGFNKSAITSSASFAGSPTALVRKRSSAARRESRSNA